MSDEGRNVAQILQDKQTWWVHFLIVSAICITGLIYLGTQTYTGAPPLEAFTSATAAQCAPQSRWISSPRPRDPSLGRHG